MGILCNCTYFLMSKVIFSVYGETPKITTRTFCGATIYFFQQLQTEEQYSVHSPAQV